MKKKITLKIVAEAEYNLNDENISNLIDIINKKMDICFKAVVSPPIAIPNKEAAEILNVEYSIISEEI